ncbi:hypothetical protein OOJ09_22190 [Mesorhizobium qingshengii]|uniref:Uncharacterized protein n=1 Tax=Mesorhizobium qingshengii TaxID=1165689 RepID=A0ABT4QZ85_9HYPH|nr:hypothetical protein [Mesorhizobium qingshengii]MCZ8546906.1 hypothetical protein [Mesorhizobium qingshengii]
MPDGSEIGCPKPHHHAGKMGDAYAALTGNPIYFARWFAPDHPSVYCDDPDALILVQALGLDPAAILAP